MKKLSWLLFLSLMLLLSAALANDEITEQVQDNIKVEASGVFLEGGTVYVDVVVKNKSKNSGVVSSGYRVVCAAKQKDEKINLGKKNAIEPLGNVRVGFEVSTADLWENIETQFCAIVPEVYLEEDGARKKYIGDTVVVLKSGGGVRVMSDEELRQEIKERKIQPMIFQYEEE